MKKLLLATTLLTAGGQALAADLPVKAPIAPAQRVALNWTGCFIGGHIGAGWSRTDLSDPSSPGDVISANSNAGFLGGGQVGCDYQIARHWVVGVEADFSWADIHASRTNAFDIDPFFGSKNFSSRTESLATLAGRVGYTWDRWMLYGKGGAAWARDHYVQSFDFVFLGSGTSDAKVTRFGWVAGGGIEWAFRDNWSVKLEYDHYDFGTKRVLFVDQSGDGDLGNVRQSIDAVKLGLNYRFNWGRPVPPPP